MPVRSCGLALLAVTSIAITLTSCSSTGAGKSGASAGGSASPAASTVAKATSAAVPAGYKRVGGAAQGISVAIPASWVEVDLAKQTLESAANKLEVPGISTSTLVQDMESLKKLHGIYALDVGSATSNPVHYVRTLNLYCGPSGVTDTGSAGVQFIEEVAKIQLSTYASHITQRSVQIGGVPGAETSYQLSSKTYGELDGSQLEVLPKPDQACFMTVTVRSPENAGSLLAVAAATAQFP